MQNIVYAMLHMQKKGGECLIFLSVRSALLKKLLADFAVLSNVGNVQTAIIRNANAIVIELS